MHSKLIDHQKVSLSELSAYEQNLKTQENYEQQKPFLFRVSYLGTMDMYSDVETVGNYLDAHEGWFCRCAQPMQVEPLNDNGYILTVGCFSSFGYEVEPKIAVVLNSTVEKVYNMETVPIPNYNPPGYEVDYHASLELTEVNKDNTPKRQLNLKLFKGSNTQAIPTTITQVNWTMDLAVKVWFPKFIYKLSPNLIQSTGDRLLSQIIRQISPRLTYKVQQDFHTRYNLPVPPKNGIKLEKVPISP